LGGLVSFLGNMDGDPGFKILKGTRWNPKQTRPQDYTTMFTILRGTIITFLGVLPSKYGAVRVSAITVFSTSSLGISAGRLMVNRVLPLKEMG
jgi:hypothetical protein